QRRPRAAALALLLSLPVGAGLLQLRLLQTPLHVRLVVRHRPRHLAGVARPALALSRQTRPRQPDQLGVRPAGVEAGEGVVEQSLPRRGVDRVAVGPPEGRLAPQDLAEGGAEAAHVAAL